MSDPTPIPPDAVPETPQPAQPAQPAKRRYVTERIKLPLTRMATEFDVDKKTLEKGLERAGIKVEKGKCYTISECKRALRSEYDEAKLANMQATARERTVKAAKSEGGVIPSEACALFITKTFAPIREALVAMPGQLAAKVNPADPIHAQSVLNLWRDESLRRFREFKPDLPVPAVKPETQTNPPPR
jgi:hypothetical protein